MNLQPMTSIFFKHSIQVLVLYFAMQHPNPNAMAVSTSLVPFSNTNPYADNFRLKVRPVLIDGESFMIRQSWDERADDEPEPTGLKWTGAAVWDAAILLSEYLAKNPELVRGKHVLELGAGHALVSVVCARFGARKVTATDYNERVLKLARVNVDHNVQGDNSTQCVEVKQLGWGTNDIDSFEASSFDLVVGSDGKIALTFCHCSGEVIISWQLFTIRDYSNRSSKR